MGRAYLLTGRPGVGKTTCLRRALELAGMPAGGFLTEELREGGTRVGFALRTLAGPRAPEERSSPPGSRARTADESRRATLAHVRRAGPPRVGKYGVDVDALERVGVPAIRAAVGEGRLVVIDEIGKMEMTSAAFRAAVEEALRSPAVVLGTILAAPHPWADRIKTDPAVSLIEVTPANREALPGRLAELVTARSP